MSRRTLVPLQLGTLVAFVALWEWATSTGRLDPAVFGQPAEIASKLGEWFGDGTIWAEMRATLQVIVLGYLSGVLGGVMVGVLVGMSTVARAFLEPFLVFFNSVPRAVLVPVFVTWLGYGMAPKVLLVFLAIVFVVIINVAAGVRGIEGDLLVNAKVQGASTWHLARHVLIPALALWILGSARVAVGLAFQVAVVAEFFGSFKGLGYLLIRAQTQFDVAGLYAALVVMMALAWGFDILLAALERFSTRWMPPRGLNR